MFFYFFICAERNFLERNISEIFHENMHIIMTSHCHVIYSKFYYYLPSLPPHNTPLTRRNCASNRRHNLLLITIKQFAAFIAIIHFFFCASFYYCTSFYAAKHSISFFTYASSLLRETNLKAQNVICYEIISTISCLRFLVIIIMPFLKCYTKR